MTKQLVTMGVAYKCMDCEHAFDLEDLAEPYESGEPYRCTNCGSQFFQIIK